MRDLPTGTVTLLFTDIEGSTRLLHDLGERYAEVLAEHRRVLRDAFQHHGGVEVDTQGDAFFYVFAEAIEAVAAAEQAQEALSSGPVAVRMGLHTGEPTLADEGYIGLDVHRAARIMGAGHGGQVLVSATTRGLVSSVVALRDLGEHRLKDIEAAEWLYQLGRQAFPPLKTISNTNLPSPASSFVGRRGELEQVLALLRDDSVRLLTLTGPGGTGKTRLALEAAAEVVGSYRNGVFWVPLAPVRDSALVTPTIAQTLGAKDGLAEHLGERELLVLLDNFEQVVEVAPELAALLERCPNLSLLATSRELLRVRGEVEYEVPPLSEPEAVELFCQRSHSQPSTEVTHLCMRLDNIPLAVELAAARAKVLSPAQILDRLSQRLDLLTGGRDADPRQRTLRATIEWSHELLSENEQKLFARLSVFAGGCTLEAAQTVADAGVDDLQSLVEKSLLRFTNERFWMLETIREYASERLAESGEAEESRHRHVEFVLQLASQVETTFASHDERTKFQFEQDNFRAALAWTEQTGDTDSQLDLIGRSWSFWWYRGHPAEGLRWVRSALARGDGEQGSRHAKVLAAGAMFACRLGQHETLKEYASESLDLAHKLGDRPGTTWPLIFLGLWASEVGNYEEATKLYDEAAAVARETGERKLVGVVMNNLGVVAMHQEDFAHAATLFEEALAISRELRTPDEIALESVNLAWCLHHTGRSVEAAKAAREGVALAREVENLPALIDGLVLIAALACRRGNANAGARLLGAAEVVRDRAGDVASGADEDLATTVKQVLLALGEGAYANALAEGRRMSLDEAVEYGLASVR